MTDQNAEKLPRRKNVDARVWLRVAVVMIFLVVVNLLAHGFRVTLCVDTVTGAQCRSQAAIGETWAWLITGVTLLASLLVLFRAFRLRV